jgi:hypothetical protein
MRVLPVLAFAVSAVTGVVHAQPINAPHRVEGDSWQFQDINLWSSKLVSRSTQKTIGVSGDYVRSYFETQAIGQSGEIIKPVVSEITGRADLNQVVMYQGEQQDQTWYK